MIRHFIALSLLSLLAPAIAAQAGEPVTGDHSTGILAPAGTVVSFDGVSKALPVGLDGIGPGKASFSTAKPAVSVALCGVEAYGANTDLDAGLIDFNVPDTARAAGGSSDEPKKPAQNVPDYHSSVVLGVTLGYHF